MTTASHAIDTVALWGPDHTELGEVATGSIGADPTIALSRGRFPKGYPSVDLNEDAVLASRRGDSVILAVADGHNGFDAAREALHAVGALLPELHRDPASTVGLGAVVVERTRISLERADRERQGTGTALLVAAVSGGRIRIHAWGDAGAVVVRRGRVRRLDKKTPFLTTDSDHRGFVSDMRVRPGDTVIAATDGLFDFIGDGWRALADHVAGDPSAVVRTLMAATFASAGSDNVAIAVTRVGAMTTTGAGRGGG